MNQAKFTTLKKNPKLCSSPCSSQFLQPQKRKRARDKRKITFS